MQAKAITASRRVTVTGSLPAADANGDINGTWSANVTLRVREHDKVVATDTRHTQRRRKISGTYPPATTRTLTLA